MADLARQWDRFEAPFTRLGVHLSNTQKQFEESAKALSRFSDRLSSIAGGVDEKLEVDRELEPPVLSHGKIEN